MDEKSISEVGIQLDPGTHYLDDQFQTFCMCKHEEKYCPHCNAVFECKVGNVSNCQCAGISFSEEERKFIAAKYSDCLCAKCMLQLKSAYIIARREHELNMFFKGR